MHSRIRRLKEITREFSSNIRIIDFAAENIDVGRIGLISKVTGNAGGFDQLNHGVTRDFFIFAKIDNDGVLEALHLD
jgi:hypothetical protein